MADKICGIYKITSPTGRVYIGQAVDIENRWSNHRYFHNRIDKQPRLFRSFNKHGIENHTFEVIEECSKEDLNSRERYWQDFYDVLSEKGLNCKLTQTDEKPQKESEETRLKRSLSQIGENNHMWGKTGEQHHSFGKSPSDETRKRMSDNHHTKKEGYVSPNKGVKRPIEFGEKISKSKKGKPNLKNRGENHHFWGKTGELCHFYGLKRTEEEIEKSRQTRIKNGKMKGGGNPAARMVLCTETGIFYDCGKDAAIAYNISPRNLSRYLSETSGRNNPTSLIYI